MVMVSGPVGELVLWIFGRQAHARVDYDGPADAVDALRVGELRHLIDTSDLPSTMNEPRFDPPEGLPLAHAQAASPATVPSRRRTGARRSSTAGGSAAKVALGEPVTVTADVFGDGHDAIAAGLRWRTVSRPRAAARRGPSCRCRGGVNDRYTARSCPTASAATSSR